MAEQVIDASIAIKWLIDDEPFCDNARKLLFNAKQAGLMLIAPPILVYEVESVLQFRLRRSLASLSAVDESLDTFYDISVKILTHPDMVIYARKIARSFQQNRIYDSLYAALAELRGCEFWTADKVFFNAVSLELQFVKYLPDYS
ncbi:MAG: hypothetical protein QG641_1873 [Candidatus Poribacteria bacterium]|nr:hypothetical protein [Candidatus Poribacteria bacterium]